MSEELDFSTGMPSPDLAHYLPLYLDETSEQLDGLVESLLVLEREPRDAGQLNEAFRLIHSIKGSSGMMGLDGITILTHRLENHFERLRSGLVQLDRQSMGLVLRCIDFLRECNRRLRAGEGLASAPELLEELNSLAAVGRAPAVAVGEDPAPVADQLPSGALAEPSGEPTTAAGPQAVPLPMPGSLPHRDFLVTVRFEPELQLADLKAELVVTRLSEIGTVRETLPARSDLGSVAGGSGLQVLLTSDRAADNLRGAADVDGVKTIEIAEGATAFAVAEAAATGSESGEGPAGEAGAQPSAPVAAGGPAPESRSKVVETVRVDIGRLDHLMNLAGELVINKARFVQIARQMSPAFKKAGMSGRARGFTDSMRQALKSMKAQAGNGAAGCARGWNDPFHELESELDAFEEQSRLWEESRRSFGQFMEAIDQMSRVSDSLQRGVLETRMVPVAPLLNRFKRVVRDIALELGKVVHFEIRGENTELDKRMIDELGDPLVHLVRNAIDHGIESAEMRRRRGKPESGTICLEAAHSGNNVLVSVRDDGGGIDVEKVRQRIVERGLAPQSVARELPEQDVIEYIWHPGFSTADVVSDISGRGVGMDIVKTRIAELNGSIDVEHAIGRGTTFTIRLPLTLAIIRSLLFRLRYGVFAVPIDNIREIVSVPVDQIVTIRERRMFEVRGEFIPLVDISDIFQWHSVPYRYPGSREVAEDRDPARLNVVILQAGDRTMGLKVNELQGGQDIVIKSLAENFVHIRGLSGAGILGDGSVCLLLDVGAAIALAADATKGRED